MSKELSAKQRSALQRVINDPELQPWLFKKVSDPIWFDAFYENNFLLPALNPRPVETKENTYHVPSWPITEYLVSSSIKIKEENNFEAAKKYLALIKDITNYSIYNGFSNHRTWWQFSKILRNLPVGIISTEDLKCISFWLEDKFDRSLVSKEISEWLSELVNNNDDNSKSIALSLLGLLFYISSNKSRYSVEKEEAVMSFDSYRAIEFVKKNASNIGEKLGFSAIEIIEKKLTEVLDINGNDRWSNLWRNSIEDHGKNIRHNDTGDIILNLFRDSMIGYYKQNRTVESEFKITSLLNSNYQTFKRIAIYIANECFEYLDESTIELVISRSHFNDKYRHELWHFLNQHFGRLSEANKSSVIESISSLEVKNETGALEEVPTAYSRANWYAALIDVDDEARKSYQKCVDIAGVEPDHPDFSCYSSVGTVVKKSPLSVVELALMLNEPRELVQFLNGYEYVGHFGEEGIEGLVEAFAALVSLEDCVVLNNLDYFVDLKPHYLHELFSSYLKLWSSKQQRNWGVLWPKLIHFADQVFQKEAFWRAPDNQNSGAFIGDVHWVVSAYSRLIESGCEKDAYAFDIALCEPVKSTLERILEREAGRDFKKDSDAVSITINSPRGRCLEAYFKLALYQCRNVTVDSEQHKEIWSTYEPWFTKELDKPNTSNEYEFITLSVMYVRNFMFLSKEWTSTNIEGMFGQMGSQQWLCAIQAYSYVGRLIPEVHAIFMGKGYYLALLDNPHLNDEVKGRYIEYICIAYLQEIENPDDPNGLLIQILSRGREQELGKLIWFLWSISDQKIETSKTLVFWLWPKLIEFIKSQPTEHKKLASKLGFWTEYIECCDAHSKSWLLEIAPFINDDYNGPFFMKELARLSAADALNVADIWKATLKNPFYIYELDSIEQIFKNLISLGEEGKIRAIEIADMYIKIGNEEVVSTYRNIIKGEN